MCFHFMFFIISTLFAIVAYYSFEAHTFLMVFWLTISIWNGANFYMEYFARKYDESLRRLDQIELRLFKAKKKSTQE